MSAGATPKAMTSDSESSSAPNRLWARSKRAIRPSIASSTPAKTTQPERLAPFLADMAKRTPVRPKHKASAVTALGTKRTQRNAAGAAPASVTG